jgi:hypothetical protein
MSKQTTGRKRWRQWTPEQAGRQLRAWKASGLPLQQFARQRGLSAQRLRWWRDRQNDWKPAAGGEPGLAPVVVAGTDAAPPTYASAVTIRLPGDVVLELADATVVPADWVVAVVGGLSRVG